MMAELDVRIKGKFKVDFAEKPRRYNAQYFWPDVKPWPPHVIQMAVEGELLDSYQVFINLNSYPIHPGCLVLMDSLDNVERVFYPQDLKGDFYLLKEVNE
jgi:hypothetical protein